MPGGGFVLSPSLAGLDRARSSGAAKRDKKRQEEPDDWHFGTSNSCGRDRVIAG
jgi:hypothetical protein